MSTIPTCAVTGAIPGDGGACGDCDPCIDGERLVPEPVKRLIAEKNSLIDQVCELQGKLDEAHLAPVEMDEKTIQTLIDSAPEPLRKLGEYLADVLAEDQWAHAEQYLLALAAAPNREP